MKNIVTFLLIVLSFNYVAAESCATDTSMQNTTELSKSVIGLVEKCEETPSSADDRLLVFIQRLNPYIAGLYSDNYEKISGKKNPFQAVCIHKSTIPPKDSLLLEWTSNWQKTLTKDANEPFDIESTELWLGRLGGIQDNIKSAEKDRDASRKIMLVEDVRNEIGKVRSDFLKFKKSVAYSQLSAPGQELASIVDELTSLKSAHLKFCDQLKSSDMSFLDVLSEKVDRKISEMTWLQKNVSNKSGYAKLLKLQEQVKATSAHVKKIGVEKIFSTGDNQITIDPNGKIGSMQVL